MNCCLFVFQFFFSIFSCAFPKKVEMNPSKMIE